MQRADILRELAAIDTAIQAHITHITKLKTELVTSSTHQDVARIRTSYDVVKHELAHAEAKRARLRAQLHSHNQALAMPVRKPRRLARLAASLATLRKLSPTQQT